MAPPQFTVLIRLPFSRGSFEDPPQAQWSSEKDRQLWKIIYKSSRQGELDWVDLATKFQVPPAFLVKQAAWLYERHLNSMRAQMKKVNISNTNLSPTPPGGGSTTTAIGGVAMRRGGSAGSAQRATSGLSMHSKESPSLRGAETAKIAPALSRTPSTTTITQSRTQAPTRTLSNRSAQRPNLASRLSGERIGTSAKPPPAYRRNSAESAEEPASQSSSSSSSSDTDHPVHRSQLFKRPPRFKQQPPRGLSTFEEGDGALDAEDSGSHDYPALPFASPATHQRDSAKYAQDTMFRTSSKPEQKVLQTDRVRPAQPVRKQSIDQQSQTTTETASSMTSSGPLSDAQTGGPAAAMKSPMSPPDNHRAELARLGSPRQRDLRKEGSEGTPSMGSSFSDIDDAGISQSALEEALLSNMQHGRMSTLSRMSRFI